MKEAVLPGMGRMSNGKGPYQGVCYVDGERHELRLGLAEDPESEAFGSNTLVLSRQGVHWWNTYKRPEVAEMAAKEIEKSGVTKVQLEESGFVKNTWMKVHGGKR